DEHFRVAKDAAHLEIKRLKIRPTAIGLKPPSFFEIGVRVAPKKEGRTEGGIPPARTRLAKSASDSHKVSPGCCIISFRCWGLRPSLPPAEPEEKLRTADLIVTAFTIRGGED